MKTGNAKANEFSQNHENKNLGSALDLIKVDLLMCKWAKIGKEHIVAQRRDAI